MIGNHNCGEVEWSENQPPSVGTKVMLEGHSRSAHDIHHFESVTGAIVQIEALGLDLLPSVRCCTLPRSSSILNVEAYDRPLRESAGRTLHTKILGRCLDALAM